MPKFTREQERYYNQEFKILLGDRGIPKNPWDWEALRKLARNNTEKHFNEMKNNSNAYAGWELEDRREYGFKSVLALD